MALLALTDNEVVVSFIINKKNPFNTVANSNPLNAFNVNLEFWQIKTSDSTIAVLYIYIYI